ASGPEVVARVVPDHRDPSGGRIERDLREELAVGGAVVVHARRGAPGGAVVVGEANDNVRVVLFVLLLERVDHVDATTVWTAGAVPGQARLRVDRAIRLRRDEVEPADVRIGDEDAAAEPRRAEPVRIDVHEELAAT